MKTLIFFLCLTTSAFALTPVERETITQAQAKIKTLHDQIDASQKAKESALVSLTLGVTQIADLNKAAKDAATAAATLTAERDSLKDTVSSQAATILLQKADKAALLASFHVFKFWTASVVALLVAGLVGLLIFRFAAPALNTIPGCVMAFGVPAAAGAAVFTLIITR